MARDLESPHVPALNPRVSLAQSVWSHHLPKPDAAWRADIMEHFAGPRVLMRVTELDMHRLDILDRKEMAQDTLGLGYCTITTCCTEVCPEHIKFTDNA